MKPQLASILAAVLGTGWSHADLVCHWRLDEGSGTTTTEAISSTASDVFGTGIVWSASTPGPASVASLTADGAATARFGTNRNAQDVGINGSGTKTIVSWFKTSNPSSGTTRYLWGWSPTNGLTNGADLRFGVQNGGLRFEITGGAATNTVSLVNDGNWHMAAAIIEANDTISTIQFYLDGNLITATGNTSQLINTAGTGGSGPPTPNEFYIGSNGNGTANNWIGSIDDVRIYNTALSKAELDAIRDAMSVAPPPPLLWNNGSGNGLWNVVSLNWNDGASDVAFTNEDEVRFEDTLNRVEEIQIVGTVEPGKTTFANVLTDYEFSGTGTIGGSGPGVALAGGYVQFTNTGGLTFSESLSIGGGSRVILGTAGAHGSTSIGTGSVFEFIDGASLAGPVVNAGQILDGAATGTVTLAGAISGGGSFVKDGTATTRFNAVNTYTGNTSLAAGVTEVGPTGMLYYGGYRNTSFLTVDTGATLRIVSYNYNATGTPNGGLGGLPDYSVHRQLNGGTLEITGPSQASGLDFRVGTNGGTFRYNPADPADTLTLRGNNNDNIRISGPLVFDAIGNIALDGTATSSTAAIQDGTAAGSLTKTGSGTLTLGHTNTYTGVTTATAGSLVLNSNGALTFVIGANGSSNNVVGAGSATFGGRFILNLTGADTTPGNSWVIAAVASQSFDASTFSVSDGTNVFSENSPGIHSFDDGTSVWTFTESSGTLSVAATSAGGYSAWAADNAPSGSSADDYDEDGVANGVEYLLGGLATTNDSGRVPTVSTPGENLVFSFLKDASVTDAAWSIEVGTTLDAWPSTYEAGDPEVLVEHDAEPGLDRVTLTLARVPDSKKFARLSVTIP
jgi:autotransporter-associated beta strand protein